MPDHVFRHRELVVDLAIVNLEFETDEVREDGRGAGVSLDRRSGGLSWLWSDDREPALVMLNNHDKNATAMEAIREDVWSCGRNVSEVLTMRDVRATNLSTQSA